MDHHDEEREGELLVVCPVDEIVEAGQEVCVEEVLQLVVADGLLNEALNVGVGD